jgi:hypothetical protein
MLDISPRSKTKPTKTSLAQWNTSVTGLNYVILFAERINTIKNADTLLPGGKNFWPTNKCCKKKRLSSCLVTRIQDKAISTLNLAYSIRRARSPAARLLASTQRRILPATGMCGTAIFSCIPVLLRNAQTFEHPLQRSTGNVRQPLRIRLFICHME